MRALCSGRLAGAIVGQLEASLVSPELVPSALKQASADDRVPVDLLHNMLGESAEYFQDEQLGLKLGNRLSLGELGTLDYLLRSAPTVRASLEAAGRYSSLQADGYHVLFERHRGGGILRLVDETSWPRTVADMAMSVAYAVHVGQRARFSSRLECWFPYTAPSDPGVHERCFPGATLRFDAPFYAFCFDESYERAPQPGADPFLHELLCDRLDAVMIDVARTHGLRNRVNQAIAREIREGRVTSASAVARSLGMGRRTLGRKLHEQGTTYADEFDAVRSEMALAQVNTSERPFAEVAYLLGFSHVESFHRAFKRWTGMTPRVQRLQAQRRVAE